MTLPADTVQLSFIRSNIRDFASLARYAYAGMILQTVAPPRPSPMVYWLTTCRSSAEGCQKRGG